MMDNGLNENTVLKIHGLFEKFPKIENAILYGSRAMGTYRNGSNIDLTLSGNLSRDNLSKITWQLDDLMLPYMIDLSILKDINNPSLIDHINRRGQIFYERSIVMQ